jgi:hypothetical protein
MFIFEDNYVDYNNSINIYNRFKNYGNDYKHTLSNDCDDLSNDILADISQNHLYRPNSEI